MPSLLDRLRGFLGSHRTSSLGRRGLTSIYVGILLGLCGLIGWGMPAVWRLGVFPRIGVAAPLSDSTVVFGPLQLVASPSGASNVEQLTFPVDASRHYYVRLDNGAMDGSARVTRGSLSVNGHIVIDSSQFTSATASVTKAISLTGSGDVLTVVLTGPTTSYATVSIGSTGSNDVTIFGSATYTAAQGAPVADDTAFTADPHGGPYTLLIYNGDSAGNLRLSSASVTLNGVTILSSTDFNQNVWSFVRTITLDSVNHLSVVAVAPKRGTLTVRITAPDTAHPVLTIATPTPGTVTRDSSVLVSGTVHDLVSVQVAVNGQSATLNGSGGWSATVPLPQEGNNTLSIVATNAAGLSTDSSRVVRRDTQAPVVTVTAPANGFLTHDTVVTVTGTASDASTFSLNVNGVPFTHDSTGAFSGTVPVVEGSNPITVTATDQVGNSRSTVVTVRRNTHPPVLAVTAPAPNAIVGDTTVLVSGTVTDAFPTVVTVNGASAPVDSTGRWVVRVPLPVEGINTLAISAVDPTGLRADSSRTVRRDTQPPSILLTAPTDNLLTNTASVVVSGVAQDSSGVSVSVNGHVFIVGPNGVFSGPVSLSEGVNLLTAVATDGAGHTATAERTVRLDTQAPTITIASPADGATLNQASVTVQGTAVDSSAVTVTVNGQAAAVSGSSFSVDVPLAVGSDPISVTATDAAGNSASASITVTRPNPQGTPPPDPATLAPPLNPTVPTTTYSATQFLYTGPNAIQTGVAPGAISPIQAAVVRGKVLDASGAPIPIATVTVLNHPEFGQTLTRADGAFDLAFNGGGTLTFEYAKAGYLSSEHPVTVQWQEWTQADSVVLVRQDTAVTFVDFSQPIEVARATPTHDTAGTRQATLLFKQGTQASLTMPDGSLQPVSGLHVRATEYTVGPLGLAAMPGKLPVTTAYTYAADLSADEAAAAGATGVQFSQPVSFYVENFLHLPVGVLIPLGAYDPGTTTWTPEPDGRVIKIASVTGGLADLIVDTTRQVAGATALTALGISDSERAELAVLYPVGQELWRTRHTHFSVHDWNFPFTFPNPSWFPYLHLDRLVKPFECKSCKSGGSVIDVENRTLGEALPVTGTPFTLHYESNRAPGFAGDRVINLPISHSVDSGTIVRTGRVQGPNEYPSNLKGIVYELSVAGKIFYISPHRDSATTDAATVAWDGRDLLGRYTVGQQKATLTIQYTYSAAPYGLTGTNGGGSGGGGGGGSFGGGGGNIAFSNDAMNARNPLVIREQAWTGYLGNYDSRGEGLGGWTLDVHHVYDPLSQTLFEGDGSRRTASFIGSTIQSVPGTQGTAAGLGGGGHPVYDRWGPEGMAVGPDGATYIGYPSEGVIRRLTTDGQLEVWFRGANPHQIAFGPDGSLYVCQSDVNNVIRIWPDKHVTVVAGNGVSGYNGDSIPATQAELANPEGVAVGADGTVFIADYYNNRIRRVAPNGIITTYAGGPGTGFDGDGGLATRATLSNPAWLMLMPDGTLFFKQGSLGFWADLIRKVTPDGKIAGVYGWGTRIFVHQMIPAADGVGFYIGLSNKVLLLDNNVLSTIAGQDETRCTFLPQGTICQPTNGDGGLPTQAFFTELHGMALRSDGVLYLGDNGDSRIRVVTPTLPGLGLGELAVASEDGSEVYEFDGSGRHLRTVDALSHDTLLTFAYSDSGYLSGITDIDGNQTVIQRDTHGAPLAIVGPYGQMTTLSVDSAGFLNQLVDPAGDVTRFVSTSGGLLTGMTDPRGGHHGFGYDAYGLVVADSSPDGRVKSLATAETDTSKTVTISDDLGRTEVHRTDEFGNLNRQRTITDAAGLKTTSVTAPGGTTTTVTVPDGTITTLTQTGDPRFGMQTPVTMSATVHTPGGLTNTVTSRRVAHLADTLDALSAAWVLDSATINGQVFQSLYTRSTRTSVTTSPMGRTTTTLYDSLGRVSESQVPGVSPASFQYDGRGRLTRAQSGGRISTFAYDAQGRLLSTTDPLGRTDSLFYDAADRLSRRVLPDGRVVQFAYDSSGNLTAVTPPGRPAHALQYSVADELAAYVPPTAGLPVSATTYDYNTARQVTAIHRPDGITVGFGYDAAGRPSTVNFDRGQIGFGYSPTTGNLTTLTAPGGNGLTFTYDGSLPTGVTWSGTVSGSTAVTYDANFRVTGQTVNGSNAVTFGYDRDGLLTQAGQLGLARDAQNGRLVADSLGGAKSSYAYDSHGALAGMTAAVNGTSLFGTTYTRDSLGRITDLAEQIQGATHDRQFTYDSAGRLATVTVDGVLAASYAYDANGNRLSRTTPSGVAAGVYDEQDRLLSYGAANYTYGANGELQTKVVGTDTTQYTYDALGNLVHVRLPDGTAIDYVIDAQNRRIGKRVNGTLVQGWLYQGQLTPVAELDASGNVVSRFVYGSGINVPDYVVKGDSTYRLIRDHLGSVRLVVNVQSGAVVERVDYDEYGVETQNTNPGWQPFGFAGGLTDAQTGLVRFGARDYDPVSGRWTAKDPDRFDGGDANLYVYSGADPINTLDPSGTYAFWDDLAFTVGGGLVGVGGQFIANMVTGHSGGYLGAFVGGAITGEATLYGQPALGGVLGSLAQNSVDQITAELSGKQDSYDVGNALEALASGAIGGKLAEFLPHSAIEGIDAGRNSFNAIFGQITTKARGGLLAAIRPLTALKMVIGKSFAGRWLPASVLSGVIGNILCALQR